MVQPRRYGYALLTLVITCLLSQVLWAHAILVASTPKPGDTVRSGGMDISLRFNVRIDGQRSRLTIKMPDGTMHNLHITQDPATPNVLQSHIDDLPAGACTLTWNVLASDGHMSKGQIPFTAQ